jgi:hypothetical protein
VWREVWNGLQYEGVGTRMLAGEQDGLGSRHPSRDKRYALIRWDEVCNYKGVRAFALLPSPSELLRILAG